MNSCLTVINDTHIGAIRSSGTTPVTQLKLRQHILSEFRRLMPNEGDLMILGDLFDKENIPISDILETYRILKSWLTKGFNLYLVAGNHDLSKTSSTMSSFDFLGKLLLEQAPMQVTVIHTGTLTPYGYVIPHVANQDLFDLELTKVPECACLFLHCNYDNKFAVQADQSLNITPEQARNAPVKHIIIAHEHHRRTVGRVILPGNQIATSVSDWLSNNDKFYLQITESVVEHKVFKLKRDDFSDWALGSKTPLPLCNFTRVVGTVPASLAGETASSIAKVRQQSISLVVSNAVDIQHEDHTETFEAALASTESFNVWESLKKILTEPQLKKLEQLNAG